MSGIFNNNIAVSKIGRSYNKRYLVYFISVFLTQGSAHNWQVDFTGNTFFSSSYLTAGSHDLSNQQDIESLIDHVLTKYNNVGFPFCRIAPEVVYKNNAMDKIILKIDEGTRVIVADYLFNIKGGTEVSAIKKIIHSQTGNYFSSQKIARSKKILSNTGAFGDITDYIVYRNDNYYLLFDITEKRSDYVMALGSFAEGNSNLGVNFHSLNLLGTLRRMEFQYEYQTLFSLQFIEPILIAPSVFALNFSLWTQDSARLTKFTGRFTAPLGQYFSTSISTGFEAVSYYTENVDIQSHIDNLLGMGVSMDLGELGVALRQELNFEYLFRTFARWTIKYDGELTFHRLVFKPHCYWVKTDAFEYFDYFRIGGAKNMRGYLEDEFISSKVLWLNCEYHRFFFFPLFDIGLIDDDIYYAYGLGLKAESDFANTSLTFAWPRAGRWRDGKVHLVFETGF